MERWGENNSKTNWGRESKVREREREEVTLLKLSESQELRKNKTKPHDMMMDVVGFDVSAVEEQRKQREQQMPEKSGIV